MPLDIAAVPVPQSPEKAFSPPVSSDSKRSQYQKVKGPKDSTVEMPAATPKEIQPDSEHPDETAEAVEWGFVIPASLVSFCVRNIIFHPTYIFVMR